MYKTIAIITTSILITGIMLYGNLIAKRGGIVDDSILDTNDVYYKMDHNARMLSAKGFKTGETISFVIPFSGSHLQITDLQYVKYFTDALMREFPEYGILSLSQIPHYRDTGTELINTPYITDSFLHELERNDSGEAIVNWMREITLDPAVYGVLIGRNFNFAQVILLLPSQYNEVHVFRKVTQFLEQRSIPAWQWTLKTDLYPTRQFQRVLPAGWVMARGLMDAALTSDILKLSTVGLLLVAIAFCLSLCSFKQSLIASLVILISFIWTRGSLGLLQAFGFDLYERVYFMLVYTALIVSGISFVERKFDSFNEERANAPSDSLGVRPSNTVFC